MARPSLGKVRFMTSLPPVLLQWLDGQARDSHRTRGDVIQEIIEQEAKRRGAPAKPRPAKAAKAAKA